MYLISIASTFAIIMIILNPQMIFGAYAPDEVEIPQTNYPTNMEIYLQSREVVLILIPYLLK